MQMTEGMERTGPVQEYFLTPSEHLILSACIRRHYLEKRERVSLDELFGYLNSRSLDAIGDDKTYFFARVFVTAWISFIALTLTTLTYLSAAKIVGVFTLVFNHNFGSDVVMVLEWLMVLCFAVQAGVVWQGVGVMIRKKQLARAALRFLDLAIEEDKANDLEPRQPSSANTKDSPSP